MPSVSQKPNMFIHFAFGQLGKEGKPQEQTAKVIDSILKQKRLIARNCTEFLPSFPVPGSRPIPTRQIQKVEKDQEGHDVVWFAELDMRKQSQRSVSEGITFLPQEIPMICFIDIAFNRLKNSPHSREYGKFGLVLTNNFLSDHGIKPVLYYSEESLWQDPQIKAWNHAFNHNDKVKQQAIENEILAYRKPATYFPSFARLTTIQIKKTMADISVSSYKYDRYPVGYDFRNESEYRIVLAEENEPLDFKEDDLHMVIVPDMKAHETVKAYFAQDWSHIPEIRVFPI